MPPLLAALLMIELGCDLRIIEAIDRGQEWRHWQGDDSRYWRAHYSDNWYAGWLGHRPALLCPSTIGSFWWPKHCGRRYPRDRLSH